MLGSSVWEFSVIVKCGDRLPAEGTVDARAEDEVNVQSQPATTSTETRPSVRAQPPLLLWTDIHLETIL